MALSNLGEVYLEEGEFPRAEALFREAIQRFAAKSGSDPVYRATALVRLGRALIRQKRYEEAETETLTGYELLAKPPARRQSGCERGGKIS